MYTENLMEDIINMTYPGLTMLYRDVNLGNLHDSYEKGMIIREKGFTDASKRGGGIITTHRYAIFSNRYMDAGEYEHGSNWGLCIIQSGSYFKILDIYEECGKTNITLLQLPEQHWQFFKTNQVNIDQQVIDYSRKRFLECLIAKPILELTSKSWLDRCSFPLGMDNDGKLFSLLEERNK